jgi:hypothetical protein
MTDEAPTRLELDIAAFRAIAAAVTEAEIAGEVASVTITQLEPDLQLMADAVGVELTISGDEGGKDRVATWIVAGDGRVVAHLEDPPAGPDQD